MLLSLITFIPLMGALIIIFVAKIAKEDAKAQIEKNAPRVALFVSLVAFGLSLVLLYGFKPSDPDFQFVTEAKWLGGGIFYRLGVDGISILFVLISL